MASGITGNGFLASLSRLGLKLAIFVSVGRPLNVKYSGTTQRIDQELPETSLTHEKGVLPGTGMGSCTNDLL